MLTSYAYTISTPGPFLCSYNLVRGAMTPCLGGPWIDDTLDLCLYLFRFVQVSLFRPLVSVEFCGMVSGRVRPTSLLSARYGVWVRRRVFRPAYWFSWSTRCGCRPGVGSGSCGGCPVRHGVAPARMVPVGPSVGPVRFFGWSGGGYSARHGAVPARMVPIGPSVGPMRVRVRRRVFRPAWCRTRQMRYPWFPLILTAIS